MKTITTLAQELEDADLPVSPDEISFQMLHKLPSEYRQVVTIAYHWDDTEFTPMNVKELSDPIWLHLVISK